MKSLREQERNLHPPLHSYLHNGRWLIDQEKEGGVYTPGAGGTQCMDGVVGQCVSSVGVFKARRTIDPDNSALMCCEVTCTTADTVIDAGDISGLYFRIEGSAMTDLRFGTATAEPITIKLKYKTNVTGVYGIGISNSVTNRLYLTTFTALTTNEEESTITIPGDVTGTWLYADGTIGLNARIIFVAGSTYQSSNTNTWQTLGIFSTSSQVNFLSANTNIFYLKEIRLVKGRSAGGELTENKAQALARCQRHVKAWGGGTVVVAVQGGLYSDANQLQFVATSDVISMMRYPVVITTAGTQGTDWAVQTSGGVNHTGFTLTTGSGIIVAAKTAHGLTTASLQILTASGRITLQATL